jgi:GNAT domain-containint protein/N-acyltransferase family protein
MTLPDTDRAAALLDRLGLDEADRAAMLAARPSPGGTPFLWWRLERAYRQLVTRIGELDVWLHWPRLPAPYLYPWALACALPEVLDYHAGLGVPAEVSRATFADVGRHLAIGRRVRGRPGLLTPGWLTPHFRGVLFQLGRLQYIRVGDMARLWHDTGLTGPGLDLHIPAIGPLNPPAVEASLTTAVSFFRKHFPDTTNRYAWCNSWLLDPQLAEYLPGNANIVAFQRRFQLLPARPDRPDDDLAVLEFVFLRERTPLRPGELDRLPQDTALHRAIVTHLRAGRHWYFRPGWLALS